MGMDLYIDHMVVSKEDFEKWKNGDLCLNRYDFELITHEEYDTEYAKFVEDWKQNNPGWEDEYDDEDLAYQTTYEFINECGYITRQYWENQDLEYPEEDCFIELDDKVVWVNAKYW